MLESVDFNSKLSLGDLELLGIVNSSNIASAKFLLDNHELNVRVMLLGFFIVNSKSLDVSKYIKLKSKLKATLNQSVNFPSSAMLERINTMQASFKSQILNLKTEIKDAIDVTQGRSEVGDVYYVLRKFENKTYNNGLSVKQLLNTSFSTDSAYDLNKIEQQMFNSYYAFMLLTFKLSHELNLSKAACYQELKAAQVAKEQKFLNRQLKKVKNTVNHIKFKIKDVESSARLEEKNAKLSTALKDSKLKEIDLNKKLNVLAQDLNTATKSLINAEVQYNSAHEEKLEQIHALTKKMQALSSSNADLETKLTDAFNTVVSYEQRLDETHIIANAARDSFMQQISGLESDLKLERTRFNEASSKLDLTENKRKELISQVGELESKLLLKDRAYAKEVTSLNSNLKKLSKSCDKLESQGLEYKDLNEKLKSKLKDEALKVKILVNNVNKLQQEREQSIGEVELAYEARLAEVQAQLIETKNTFEQKIYTIEEQSSKDLTNKDKQYVQKLAKLKQQYKLKLTNTYTKIDKVSQSYESKIATILQDKDTLIADIKAEYENNLKHISQDLFNANNIVAEKNDYCNSLLDKVEYLKEEILLEKEYADELKLKHRQELAKYSKESATLKQRLAARNKELNLLEKKYLDIEQEISDKLNQSTANFKQREAELEAKLSQVIARAEDDNITANLQITKLKQTLSELKASQEDKHSGALQSQLDLVISQAQEDSLFAQKALEKIQTESNKIINDLDKSLNSQLEQSKAESKAKLEKLDLESKEKINTLNQNIAELKQAHSKELQKHYTIRDSLNQAIITSKQETESAVKENNELKEKLKAQQELMQIEVKKVEDMAIAAQAELMQQTAVILVAAQKDVKSTRELLKTAQAAAHDSKVALEAEHNRVGQASVMLAEAQAEIERTALATKDAYFNAVQTEENLAMQARKLDTNLNLSKKGGSSKVA